MKKMLCAVVLAIAFISATAFAKSQGLGPGASVATGRDGVLGLLDSRAGLALNAAVNTGKGGGVSGLLGGGCRCGHSRLMVVI